LTFGAGQRGNPLSLLDEDRSAFQILPFAKLGPIHEWNIFFVFMTTTMKKVLAQIRARTE
jgi:hypothetical protein